MSNLKGVGMIAASWSIVVAGDDYFVTEIVENGPASTYGPMTGDKAEALMRELKTIVEQVQLRVASWYRRN